jgi:hypothetical protein
MPKKKSRAQNLSGPQKKQLRVASAEAIETRMVQVASNFQRADWLPSSNTYFNQNVKKIETQGKTSPPSFSNLDLADYITVSGALHCVDGWSYLARAFCAHIQGDPYSATHLAYYAELRAAMAILASQGTGIFGRIQAIVDRKTICHPIEGYTTHQAVWMFLEYWADRKGATALLHNIIRPGSRPLVDWISGFGAGTVTSRLIAQQWCRLWGLDLKTLGDDQNTRNESSYRLTQLRRTSPVPAQDAATFVNDFWRLFRPWPPNFGVLDNYLLRKILHKAFVRTYDAQITDPRFHTHVAQMLAAVQPSGMSEQEWISFLTDTAEPVVFAYANGIADLSNSEHHMHVMSRAALLLRLASGATENLFASANVQKNDLSFWSLAFGSARGFWEPGAEPDDMLDLWQDVEEALGTFNSWRGANSADVSYANLRRNQAVPLQVLCECERIALWGAAP